MFKNKEMIDGGDPERHEELKSFFCWYVVLQQRNQDREIIEDNQIRIPDKNQTITEAKDALRRISTGKSKYRNADIRAEVWEVRNADTEEQEIRTVWEAHKNNIEGHDINGEWTPEGTVY